MLREEAAIAPAVPAGSTAVWDGRFRIRAASRELSEDFLVGKLGDAAAGFRRRSDLPSAVLRTLPAVWLGEKLVAVPHLGYRDRQAPAALEIGFAPPRPAGGAVFVEQSS